MPVGLPAFRHRRGQVTGGRCRKHDTGHHRELGDLHAPGGDTLGASSGVARVTRLRARHKSCMAIVVVVEDTASFLGLIASLTGAIIAGAAILRGAGLFWRRTYGSALDLQGRLSQLAIGVSDRFVEQLLGVPTFRHIDGDEDSTAVWVTRHCLMAAIFRKGNIFAYSIVTRDPRFHYPLGDASLTQIRGKLGSTKLVHLTRYPPQRVRAWTGASSFRYAEEHSFGRPGGYQSYVLAVGDTGANVTEPPRFRIEPGDAYADEGHPNNDIYEYRRTASPNAFTVVGSAEALEADLTLSQYVARVALSPHYRRSRGWLPWRQVSRY